MVPDPVKALGVPLVTTKSVISKPKTSSSKTMSTVNGELVGSGAVVVIVAVGLVASYSTKNSLEISFGFVAASSTTSSGIKTITPPSAVGVIVAV